MTIPRPATGVAHHPSTAGRMGTVGIGLGYVGLTALTSRLASHAFSVLTHASGHSVTSVTSLTSLRSLDVLLSATAEAAITLVWLALTWLLLVTVAAGVTRTLAGPSSVVHLRTLRLAPFGARRLMAVVLGVTVLGTTATACGGPAHRTGPRPVHAAAAVPELDRPASPTVGVASASALAGWTPDRPVAVHRMTPTEHAAVLWAATVPHRHRPHRQHQRDQRDQRDQQDQAADADVVVRRGDTLWDIAARHLGPQASLADIASAWPRWYAANRHVIGGQPDLLRPGERLRAPTSAS